MVRKYGMVSGTSSAVSRPGASRKAASRRPRASADDEEPGVGDVPADLRPEPGQEPLGRGIARLPVERADQAERRRPGRRVGAERVERRVDPERDGRDPGLRADRGDGLGEPGREGRDPRIRPQEPRLGPKHHPMPEPAREAREHGVGQVDPRQVVDVDHGPRGVGEPEPARPELLQVEDVEPPRQLLPEVPAQFGSEHVGIRFPERPPLRPEPPATRERVGAEVVVGPREEVARLLDLAGLRAGGEGRHAMPARDQPAEQDVEPPGRRVAEGRRRLDHHQDHTPRCHPETPVAAIPNRPTPGPRRSLRSPL